MKLILVTFLLVILAITFITAVAAVDSAPDNQQQAQASLGGLVGGLLGGRTFQDSTNNAQQQAQGGLLGGLTNKESSNREQDKGGLLGGLINKESNREQDKGGLLGGIGFQDSTTGGAILHSVKNLNDIDYFAFPNGRCKRKYYVSYYDNTTTVVPEYTFSSPTGLTVNTLISIENGVSLRYLEFTPLVGMNGITLTLTPPFAPPFQLTIENPYYCYPVPTNSIINFKPSSQIKLDSKEFVYRAMFNITNYNKGLEEGLISCFTTSLNFNCAIYNRVTTSRVSDPNNFEMVLSPITDRLVYPLQPISNCNITIQVPLKNYTFEVPAGIDYSEFEASSVSFLPSIGTVESKYNNRIDSIVSKFNVLNSNSDLTRKPLPFITYSYFNGGPSLFRVVRGLPVLGNTTISQYYSVTYLSTSGINGNNTFLTLNQNTPIKFVSGGSTLLNYQEIKLNPKVDTITYNSISVDLLGPTKPTSPICDTQFLGAKESQFGGYLLPPFLEPIPKIYPFSFTNGVLSNHIGSISILMNGYYAKKFNLEYENFSFSGDTTLTPLSPDNNPPNILNLNIIPLGAEKYLFRVFATDDLSGIYAIILDSVTNLFSNNLVSGTLNNGIFEKVVDNVKVTTPSRIKLSAIDLAGNIYSPNFTDIFNINLNSIPMFPVYEKMKILGIEVKKEKLIKYFRFIKNEIDVTNSPDTNILELDFTWNNLDQPPKLIVDRAPYSKDSSKVEYFASWDPSLKLYKIYFDVPARMFQGPLSYTLVVPPFYYTQNDIATIFNNTLTTQYADLLPPMVTEIINYSLDFTFGWDLVIEDEPNGFKSGRVEVQSNVDMEPWVFLLDPSLLKSGSIYKGTYHIRIQLQSATCKSQTFWISRVELTDTLGLTSSTDQSSSEHPVISPLAMFNSTITSQYAKSISCPTPYSGGTPTLLNLTFTSETDPIDVTATFPYQRMINFTIFVSDMLYGISNRNQHSPVVYLQTTGDRIVSKKSTLSNRNLTHASYQCNFEVPYGFGIGQGIIASVFGIVNNQMIVNGYSYGQLSNIPNIMYPKIKTVSSFSPMIGGYDPVRETEDKLIIYGNGFGSTKSDVTIFVDYMKTVVGFEPVPLGDIFSSVSLSVSFSPKIGFSPFKIKVVVNGKESNHYLISPIKNQVPTLPPSPTPTQTPTQVPINCEGNPICGGPNNGNITFSSLISIVSIRELDPLDKTVYEHFFNQWFLTVGTIYLGIKMPLHRYNISLDPDFSIVFNYVDAKDKDGSNCSGNSGLTKTQIAGIIIGSVAGVANFDK
eukprot:gene10348-12710_t